jgi:hypothetical protein
MREINAADEESPSTIPRYVVTVLMTSGPVFKRFFEDEREAKAYRDNMLLYLLDPSRRPLLIELHDNIHVVKAHVVAVALIDQNDTASYRG